MKITYYDANGNKISSYFSDALNKLTTIEDQHVREVIDSNTPRDYEIFSNFSYPTNLSKENRPQEIMVAVKATNPCEQ